jgi:hypothetical protein
MTYGDITLKLYATDGDGTEVELAVESITTKETFHADVDRALEAGVRDLRSKWERLRARTFRID